MAAGVLSVQNVAVTGLVPAFTAATATDGDVFTNDGRTFLHVKNGSGSSVNVTIDSVAACDQGSYHDLTIAVAAGAEKLIGPFPTKRFNNSSNQVGAVCSAVTDVTLAAIRVP